MSSSEPPSRIPPRNQPLDTKAARDELSSKGRVEKVREVDADETRKRQFQRFYDEDTNEAPIEPQMSPFDLISGRQEGFEDLESDIVPSPSYSPPPNLSDTPSTGEEEESLSNALPQSNDFWEEVDFPPEEKTPPASFQKKPGLKKEEGGKKGAVLPDKKKKGEMASSLASPSSEKKEKKEPPFLEKKLPTPPSTPPKETGKQKPPSPFEVAASLQPVKPQEKKKPLSPFEQAAAPFQALAPTESSAAAAEEEEAFGIKAKKKREEEAQLESRSYKEKKTEKHKKAVEHEETATSFHVKERDEGRRGKEKREEKIQEIVSPSLPELPSHVQPVAELAAVQAAPYISSTTTSLFYQMVGTIYTMTGPQGINRTEIVLNNPAYANSKFYGATIRIEKYTTAPDAFNITLTGSNTAVQTFRENMPSLMAAFQNGNFTFRINRLDAEYSIERPVFRRKEREEERGDAGGGDLGERRK